MEPRRIFLTGASTGIGNALARRWAGPGVFLGLNARRESLLAELARELEAKGARVSLHPGDVADTAFLARAARDYLEAAGGVDLVVANAGVANPKGVLDGDAEPVARLLSINVIGVANTVLPFVPAMRRAGSGVLAAVSSVAGHRAFPGHAAYSASKAAVITLMDGLRMELHGTGVHAMTICPGFVVTPMTESITYPMPFLVDVERAARWTDEAIRRRERTFDFPWQLRLLAPAVRALPEAVVRDLAKWAQRPRT
ncbi:MAG: SDR family NAD(P)-dependent oxidoreductase [Polyangiaceae bacterium]|nr:SDR family NAD(P)-dependent oxidoreductase [Polyangiaceae bacterium]